MADIANAKLKLIFYVHFILIVLAQICSWGSYAYLFYNLVFIIALMWSLFDHNASEPVQHAILINGASLVFDIILLSVGYPHDSNRSGDRFSAVMAIFNLVLRPFTILILHRILQERNGNLGPLEGVSSLFTGQQSQNQSHYQDIDKHESLPATSQQQHDQDFFRPAAQQI